MSPQKARNLQVHTISETDVATLQTSLQAWLADADRAEQVVVGVRVRDDGTNYYAIILFTE